MPVWPHISSYRFAKPDPYPDPIRDKGRENPLPFPSICVVAYSTLPPFGRGLPFELENPAVPAICVASYASRGAGDSIWLEVWWGSVAGEGHHVFILHFFLLTAKGRPYLPVKFNKPSCGERFRTGTLLSRTGAYSTCLGEIHVKRGDFPCVLLLVIRLLSRIAGIWNSWLSLFLFYFFLFFLSSSLARALALLLFPSPPSYNLVQPSSTSTDVLQPSNPHLPPSPGYCRGGQLTEVIIIIMSMLYDYLDLDQLQKQ